MRIRARRVDLERTARVAGATGRSFITGRHLATTGRKSSARGMVAWQRACLDIQERARSEIGRYVALPLPLAALHLVCVWLRYPSAMFRLPPADVLEGNLIAAERETRKHTGCGGGGAAEGGEGIWSTPFEVRELPCLTAEMSFAGHWNCEGSVCNRVPSVLASRADALSLSPRDYLRGNHFARVGGVLRHR